MHTKVVVLFVGIKLTLIPSCGIDSRNKIAWSDRQDFFLEGCEMSLDHAVKLTAMFRNVRCKH